MRKEKKYSLSTHVHRPSGQYIKTVAVIHSLIAGQEIILIKELSETSQYLLIRGRNTSVKP
jgi:hypothetical protein